MIRKLSSHFFSGKLSTLFFENRCRCRQRIFSEISHGFYTNNRIIFLFKNGIAYFLRIPDFVMKALLLILLVSSVVCDAPMKSPMCLCAPGQICTKGTCHDYLIPNRARRSTGCDKRCPINTYCDSGSCMSSSYFG